MRTRFSRLVVHLLGMRFNRTLQGPLLLHVLRAYAHYPAAPELRISAAASMPSGDNHADDVRWHQQTAIAKDA